jgi:transposase
MLEIEEYIMLRELHAQVFNITDISDKTGYDWMTVKKYLNLTSIPEPKHRAKKKLSWTITKIPPSEASRRVIYSFTAYRTIRNRVRDRLALYN